MPADAWLLLVLSVGLGLGLELLYMRARWTERSAGDVTATEGPDGRSDGGSGNEDPGRPPPPGHRPHGGGRS